MEIGEARRRMANERSILAEIRQSKANREGMHAETLEELEEARHAAVVSIWGLRRIINEAQAA